MRSLVLLLTLSSIVFAGENKNKDVRQEYWKEVSPSIFSKLKSLPKYPIEKIGGLLEIILKSEEKVTELFIGDERQALNRHNLAKRKGFQGAVLYLGCLPHSGLKGSSTRSKPCPYLTSPMFVFEGCRNRQNVNVFAVEPINESTPEYLCILPNGNLLSVFDWYSALVGGMYDAMHVYRQTHYYDPDDDDLKPMNQPEPRIEKKHLHLVLIKLTDSQDP